MGRIARRTLAVVTSLAAALALFGACAVDAVLNRVTEAPSEVPAEALAVHRGLTVVDLHADPLLWNRDLLVRGSRGHIDLPRLQEGGVALQVFGSATKTPWGLNFESNSGGSDMMTSLVFFQRRPRRTWGSPFERALDQAARLAAAADASGGKLRLIRTRSDLDRLLADRAADPSVVGALLGIEGLHVLEGRADRVDALFAAGFRMMGLAHFFDNEVSGSAHGVAKGGLTPFGREVVARMEALGIALDVAHAAPAAVDEAVSLATKPIVVSHTGVAATCPGPRNLSDERLRAIAAQGGVIGIGFFPGAVCGDDAVAIARAVQHARAVAGPGAVAFGSDWDGATTTPFDAAGLPRLTAALLAAGVPEDELRAIAGGNALRVLRATLPE
jgi:membrane dipeptidase